MDSRMLCRDLSMVPMLLNPCALPERLTVAHLAKFGVGGPQRACVGIIYVPCRSKCQHNEGSEFFYRELLL